MIFYSCEKSTNDLVTPPQIKNLLTNSSFEINGSPTMNGWTLSEEDTTFLRYLLRFSTDVPPGEGKSSIVVNYSFPGPWIIYQLVSADAGSHVYRLSFWARNFFGQGKVTLGLNQNIPEFLKLYQNYPNPFNSSTNIKFHTSGHGIVTIKIFNLLGEEVAIVVSKEFSPGDYSIMWNVNGLPSGIYFCQCIFNNTKLEFKSKAMKALFIK